ncbi:hypothetical protein DV515_00000474 [Chloebia gouldiae]|uniref:Uncharacterized protein n=1 Tax=Chloebia gouldiae TaxID=44316 RepID=A0A3L8T1Q7_CHLGU|nr:hypothetical protein DV515_00000474 [Chloebia gouldiae]
MRDKMRKWREENYRNSEQIVDVGEELINEYASKLGDDKSTLALKVLNYLNKLLVNSSSFLICSCFSRDL